LLVDIKYLAGLIKEEANLNRKVSLVGLSLLAIILLFVEVASPFLQAESGHTSILNPQSAQAAELENSNVYFPTIIRDVQTIFGVGLAQISSAGGLDFLTQTQSSWTRKDGVRWYDVQPDVPWEWNWEALDDLEAELITAAENKIRVVLIVQGTPSWAAENKESTCGPIEEDNLDDFALFLHELVKRYSVSPYFVKDYEIWNEPDVDAAHFEEGFGCWGDSTDEYYGGGEYGEMLIEVYPEIKKANPQARVILGGLLMDCRPDLCDPDVGGGEIPIKFLEGILVAGAGNSFDGVSFHAYDYYMGNADYGNEKWGTSRAENGPVSIEKAAFIRTLLYEYGVNGKFLMNTESALLCDGDWCTENFEQTKASYVVQAYAAALSQGYEANFWYNMLGWRNSGLVTPDLQPLDAYHTYKFASEKIGGWEYSSKVSESSGTLDGFEFKKGKRRIMVIWSKDNLSHPFVPYVTPISVYDAFGNAMEITPTIDVGQMPVYIEYIP
jgi:hypothetical protein